MVEVRIGYKEFAETSLKYKVFGIDYATMTSSDGCTVSDYYTGTHPTYDSTYTISVEITSVYVGNVNGLYTALHTYY